MADEASRPVQGGAAQPVFLVNDTLPPAGSSDGAATIADGADVTQGAIADAAVDTDTTGTLSGKLRGLVKLMVNLLSRWPAALGQQTRAGSISVTQASDATGANAQQVQGTAADGAAAAGNPVLIGGMDASNNAQAIVTDGTGRVRVTGDASTSSDSIADTNTGLQVIGFGLDYNGATWNKRRNNHEVTVLASAARTVATNSADLTNYNARGVVVAVDVTAYSAGSLTVSITGKSSLGGTYRTILASAAISATGRTILKVYPGLTAAANLVASDVLERLWRVEVAVGSADPITYSISANYVS